jgi:hypothetical protein
VDLASSDAAGSRSFYGQLFGWEAEEPNAEFGGYFNFTKDGHRLAGCMASEPGAPVTNAWAVYLATDDANKTVEAAGANGGQVVVPPTQVGDLGTMAVVLDRDGASIGVWQPGLHRGFGVQGEPGTPGWFELQAKNYPAAVDFYRDVFRWETRVASDTPELRYTVQAHGDEQLAGIMDASSFLPDGAPVQWSVYFSVADTDATLAKAVELGGSVLMDSEDTPYGRLAVAADATGAQFKLAAGG